jgi:hypothetical protein
LRRLPTLPGERTEGLPQQLEVRRTKASSLHSLAFLLEPSKLFSGAAYAHDGGRYAWAITISDL